MAEQPIIPQTPLQRLILEQALAFAQQLEAASAQAPTGQVLDRCEQATLLHGRLFLTTALAAALQQPIAEGEKRGRPPGTARADSAAGTRDSTSAPS